jgi:hypothetical protein
MGQIPNPAPNGSEQLFKPATPILTPIPIPPSTPTAPKVLDLNSSAVAPAPKSSPEHPAEAPTLPRAAPAPLAPVAAEVPATAEAEIKYARVPEAFTTDPALSALKRSRASLAWLATPRTKYVLIGLSVSVVVLALAVVFLLVRRSDNRAQTAGASEDDKNAASANSPACALKHPAARFAAAIERTVPTYVASVKGTSMVAVGFAATRTRAMGMILDPLALEGKTTFDNEGKAAVRGVIPLVLHGTPGFIVDREDSPLRSPRTVDAVPLFSVGVTDAGFVRSNDGSVTTLWPGPVADKITEPRVVTTDDGAHAVVFRSGGTSGKIVLGWMDDAGKPKTQLVPVPAAPRFLGTPYVASFADEALIVFAGRNDQNAPWRVHFSRTKSGQKPGAARELPGFGSGGGAIAPSVTGLPDGRWLLQWTEGSLGRYQVRVQTLDSDLRPVGEPVLVSPKGASAGQGVIWAGGAPAVALFILTTAGRDELWGAALACP